MTYANPAKATALDPTMKTGPALFCQVVIVCIGLAALTFLLGMPRLEGRNANATVFEIYVKDPFLAYVYVGSIPFFAALFRAFGLFGDLRQTGAFSQRTVATLRAIKRCAITLVCFVVGALAIILFFGDGEDRPPAVVMSGLVIIASSIVAAVSSALARNLQNFLNQPKPKPQRTRSADTEFTEENHG